MRFTRLRLNGFKSFVDPTDLVIAEGLTGVVGPNGCGKSNLLEALRWVMGENRPTAMRGEGMEDVIFAGAATRPARAFAEVALTLDNQDRRAPPGFNDQDVIEIARRITREAGSAYRVQGREVRARDVQMLFADASTGAHSPALVRQGQIAELIAARPQARRRVLEEAAGIAGLYQRRHEAELKLNAAEANLARVDDVVAGLAQQLAGLARAARAAARWREIGAALRRAEGLMLYRRWAEADEALAAAEAVLRTRLAEAGRAATAASAADAARARAEGALPPLREEAAIAGAVLQRLTVQEAALADERQRAEAAIRALTDRLAQIGRDAAREADLTRDAEATIARLTEEALALAEAGQGADDRIAAADEAARARSAALLLAEEAQAAATEAAARLAARHQSAERLLEDTRASMRRAEEAAGRATAAQSEAETALSRAEAALLQAQGAETRAAEMAQLADRTLAEAEAARAETQGREAEARARAAGAEGEAAALRAELGALTRLVERDTGKGGQVLDLIRVANGYEAALGAALADDLRAPLRRAGGSGWADLPPYPDPPPLPRGVAALADQVQAPAALARRLGQTGIVAAGEGDRLQAALTPGQRLVSVEGDLWRWDGFTATAREAPSAAAERLRQLNRLVELKRDLEEAQARAAGARLAHDRLAADQRALTEAETRARAARREADRQQTEAARAAAKAEADRNLALGRRDEARLALTRYRDEAATAARAADEAAATRAALPELALVRAEAEAARARAEADRSAMIAARARAEDLRRDEAARARRLGQAETEARGWRDRLDQAGTRRDELGARAARAEADLAEARSRPAELARKAADLAEALAAARRRAEAAGPALTAGETALAEAQAAERLAIRAASEAGEARARAEAEQTARQAAVAEAEDRLREVMESSPERLLAALEADPAAIPTLAALDTEIAALKRQRDALGAVNLRADEDAAEVKADHDRLVAEKADLDEAIRSLRGGIAGLNREGRERLLTAFEQVNANFGLLFSHLFGGGEARLVLVESDDPLEAGLEIMAQPPGKRLSTLSLLSGGEQTLTALALIFGVFLTNPAPICVLDEVDAPLDDANVVRFCDLLDEMVRRTETRFLIITHHAVTMARMDRLFGVTMAEQGVSQLVSVDLRRAAQMVA